MSKINVKRFAKFRNTDSSRVNPNKATGNSKSPQVRNSLQNRSKLDIKITKVSKRTNECSQRTQQSLFQTGPGSFLAPKSNTHDSESDAANSTVDNNVDQGMHSDKSPSIFTSALKTIINPIQMQSKPNSPDSSSTFFEPDSTIDDDDLDSNLILESNVISDSSILTKNTKLNIPIYHKPSSEHKAGSETPRKKPSVKKLTQYKPNSAKVKTPGISKTAAIKTKPSDEKNQKELELYDFDTASNMLPRNRNLTKKNALVYKEANPTGKKAAAAKSTNVLKLSHRRLQTQVFSSPITSGSSNSKSKPENSPGMRKIPPTSRLKSKPKFPSQELFVDDYDSNQLASSADLVLPSPDDLIEPERILIFRNRLKTPQRVMNSSKCSQSSVNSENKSRYPLRSKTAYSPVTYDLPIVRRRKSNSQSTQASFDDTRSKSRTESKSKAANGVPKSCVNRSLQFSQFSSVHESLLDFSTPQDTSIDTYDFISTSTPGRSQSQTNKKRTSAQQKIQNDSQSKAATRVRSTDKSFANAPLQFSQFSSVHESLLAIETPQDTPKDVYEFVSTSPPTKRRSQPKKKTATVKQKPRTSKSTACKKPTPSKSSNNSLFSAAFNDSLKNVPSRRSVTTPKSKPIGNPNAFSELTNQVAKKGRVKVSNNDKSKADNFLSGTFSQYCQTRSQHKSMFATLGSQTSQTYLNSRTPINSLQTFFNQASTPRQNQKNSSQTYENIFTHIDRINHTNNDAEMQELCDLFEMLNVNETAKPSFLIYRDPCRVEKSYVKINDARCEKPRKTPFADNTFMNYRMSSDSIVEENEIPFSRASVKNCTPSGINSGPFKYAGDAPVVLKDATDETNLSARDALRSIKYISTKVPYYFYADGDYNLDGFSNWD